MFDVKNLKATPSVARRLLQMSQVNGMAFGEDLIDLAMQDLLTQEEVKKVGFSLDATELGVLQYIKDWQGRAMVLTPDYKVNLKLGLAHLATCDGRSLIMADPKHYAAWALHIAAHLPGKKISVFGNPRYKPKNATWPDGVEFSEQPDLTADIFITSYGGLIWNDLLTKVAINQTIVEELDHQGALSYKWQDALKGVFHEVPAPLFLQNIHNLPRDAGADVYTSLSLPSSKACAHILEMLHSYMWAGLGGGCNGIMGSSRNEALAYLAARGYKTDLLKILNLFGFSSDLVTKQDERGMPLVFVDHALTGHNAPRNKESNLHRLVRRERELEAHTGTTIKELAQGVLEGNRPSQGVLGALESVQWANSKGLFLKSTFFSISHKKSRALFVCDNKDLIRSLQLHFSPSIGLMADDPTLLRNRFMHSVDSKLPIVMGWQEYMKLKPLNLMIVTADELYSNQDIVNSTDFVFMTSWNQSRENIESLLTEVNRAGSKLVFTVMNETFEQKIYEELLKKSS